MSAANEEIIIWQRILYFLIRRTLKYYIFMTYFTDMKAGYILHNIIFN